MPNLAYHHSLTTLNVSYKGSDLVFLILEALSHISISTPHDHYNIDLIGIENNDCTNIRTCVIC